MVSFFGKIKILLGIKADAEDKAEPTVSLPAEFQGTVLKDNTAYYDILRDESKLQDKAEELNAQDQELKHAGELERLKHYAELEKQNELDSNTLNEDLE